MDCMSRRHLLAALGTLSLAGCGGTDSDDSPERTTVVERTPTPRPTASPEPKTPTTSPTETGTPTATPGLADFETPPLADQLLPLPMAPADLRENTFSGGVPKDGIPSIDEPSFISASDGDDILAPGDIVFGVKRNGIAKAYPQPILVWHEICNDTFEDEPVSVTYCPLTGTAQGFLRGETTFGVSGRLVNNNLIMYDRETETWWPQILGSAIPGAWNENPGRATLNEFQVIWTTWKRWKGKHPETLVLSEDTGYARNYNRDPYGGYNPRGGYYASDDYFSEPLNPDDTYEPKAVFIGARTPDGAMLVKKSSLSDAGTLSGSIGDTSVLAVYDQTLDTGYLYENPDQLEFTYESGRISGPDDETYDPQELPLDRLIGFDGMWFAWHGFYPDATVVT